jgi:ATP-dependent Clp protease ATP-binding subunit ClpA
LGAELFEQGTKRIIAFDPARGFWLPPILGADPRLDRDYFSTLGLSLDDDGKAAVSLERFFELVGAMTTSAPEPTAIISDFAARLVVRADHLGDVEHRGFTRAVVAAHAVEPRPNPVTRQPGFNPVLWIVEKEGDLPDWFIVGNPRLRHIPVPKPDHLARRAVIVGLMKTLPMAHASQEAMVKAEDAFVEGTEGLLLLDLANIVQLSRAENLKATDTVEAVRRYKLGVTEDPWRRIGREKLANAEGFVLSRVKGQPLAVQHMLDIVKRAATGIGGRRGGRPRGVAFLAGPTGVGKTELAKTVTTLLFGDESAYIRFDMSEFSAQHADQRLIGAPPGYVGYDTGGELTNAIREKPFSVVLFDEIEKAHPRILDKFLQVLDDGVLTSGRGERVYFSESLIIFTSNLGITRELPDGTRTLNVTPEEAPEVMRAKVRSEIERHFKFEISRPELLNRIGENIIIFDFIRSDSGREIFDAMTARILEDIQAEQGIGIDLDDSLRAKLAALCLADLSNGGRGVRNQLEAYFVNPLARGLFALNPQIGDRFRVNDVDVRSGGTELRIDRA